MVVFITGFLPGVDAYGTTTAGPPVTIGFADTLEARALCGVEKVREICEDASVESNSVLIDCSVDFKQLDCQTASQADNVITKKLLFHGAETSGVVADFNGAHINAASGQFNHNRQDIIEINSIQNEDGRWSVPSGITIQHARISGSIRLKGMGRNGEAEAVRNSSHQPGHTARIRANAPHKISLLNLSIEGQGRTPLYFGPGVNHSMLQHSMISGISKRVAAYLDAESQAISLLGNVFDVQTTDGSFLGFYDRGWPQIAIDGSSQNIIKGNRFVDIKNGGIYLYRNCGEGGTIRYTTPSGNLIAHNRFERKRDDRGTSPAIYIGSRNYGWWENHLPGWHCNDDEVSGLNTGSAASNADFAQRNRIVDNLIQRSAEASVNQQWVGQGDQIRIGSQRHDRDNIIQGNQWIE